MVSLAHETHVAVAAYQLLVDTSALLESVKLTQVYLVSQYPIDCRVFQTW